MDELLRAVIAAPDDDAPRLVYADALMRAGDPRGEFIAMQLAGKTAEADELLAEHRATWLAALPNVLDADFERGFATKATLRCDDRRLPALAALDREPIVSLDLVPTDPDDTFQLIFDADSVSKWFATDPRAARLRMLDLSSETWGQRGLDRVLGAARNLRDLRLGDCQTYAFEPIARLPLAKLVFIGSSDAALDEGVELIASARMLSSLEQLVFLDCGLGPRAGIALGRAELPHLRRLAFTGTSNQLYDNGAIALTRPSSLPALQRLALDNSGVTDDFLEALCKPYALPLLTSLEIDSCKQVTSRGITALAASDRFGRFEELWLAGCGIDDAGVAAIARAPSKLRALNLHRNPFGAVGARALAESPLARQLVRLDVSLTPELEAILRPAFGARLIPR